MTDFVSLIIAVHDELDWATVEHAFGGALALGFVAEPRGTVDIDVNVFLTPDERGRVDAALARLGYATTTALEDVPVAGVRFSHPEQPFPIDVFPSLHDRYAATAARVVRHPFGPEGRRLPFLSAEDLCVFKLVAGRPQDWVDLAAIAASTRDLDVEYLADQLVALRGPTMHPRVARFRTLVRRQHL